MFKLTMTTVWTVPPRTCGQTMHGDVGNPASGLYPGPTTPYPLSREGRYQTRGLLSEEFQQNSWTWEVFSFTRRLAVVQKPKLEEWNSDSNTHAATSGYYREYIKASSMKAWSISTKKANYLRGFPDTESSDRTHHTEREAHVSPPGMAPFRASFITEAVSTSPHHMLEGRVAEITSCEKTSSITNCNFLFLSETFA